MRIWLINQTAQPPDTEPRRRTFEFARNLQSLGHRVRIYAGDVQHNGAMRFVPRGQRYAYRVYEEVPFVFLRTLGYRTNGLRRMLSSLLFALRFCAHLLSSRKPDAILLTSYVPFSLPIVWMAKRQKIHLVVEVLDLWPQTLVTLGILPASHWLMPPLRLCERYAYAKADRLVFSMVGGPRYVEEQRWCKARSLRVPRERMHYINNGVNLAEFDEQAASYPPQGPFFEREDVRLVVYMGSVRLANNLGALLDAASTLRHIPDIQFLIYGDGNEREELCERIQREGLSHVHFMEKWLHPRYLPGILRKASVAMLNYKPGDFGAYGASQDKLFLYMAAGVPICANIPQEDNPIIDYQLGVARHFDSPAQYGASILYLARLNQDERNALALRSRRAIAPFDYPQLARQMERLLREK